MFLIINGFNEKILNFNFEMRSSLGIFKLNKNKAFSILEKKKLLVVFFFNNRIIQKIEFFLNFLQIISKEKKKLVSFNNLLFKKIS